MDYDALYRHRFKNVNQQQRNNVWKLISEYLTSLAGNPERVLDPACGLGEFINNCQATERWASDLAMKGSELHPSIKFIQGNFLEVNLPDEYFDLIFISNVLEHLPSQFDVNEFLVHARKKLRTGGKIIVIGPNFKYCYKEYFDCADHIIPLTNISLEEHLIAAGLTIENNTARFLPYSFRSKLPAFSLTTRLYLRFRLFWRVLGKQFLLIASKDK